MAEIRLRDGTTVLIDDEDTEILSQYRWHRCGYRGRYVGTFVDRDGKRSIVYLHRLLTLASAGQQVDHINRDPLDNRRANLRIVTASQNQQNQPARGRRSTTGIRGVSWDKYHGAFVVLVYVRGRKHQIGRFKSLATAEGAAIEARQRLMTHAPECEMAS